MLITGILGGFISAKEKRTPDSLLVGQYRKGQLTFLGLVEIQNCNDFIIQLYNRLKNLEVRESPFCRPLAVNKNVHWVEPQIVVDIDCSKWCLETGFSEPKNCCLRMDISASQVQI